MRRALILIGVGRTGGNLDELQSIENSFRQMRAWADEQGFDRDQIFEISDLKGSVVRLSDIVELIQGLDDSRTPPDQLVVYFNGHGVRNGFGDLWLLSKAPNQAKEAVSLFSCLAGAYYRYFKHVVLIGDACRVHPEDKQFNSVEGASIFQNSIEDGESNSVDIFFASTVGTPALEVDINNEPTSIYTLQLSEFLRGSEPSILEMLRAPNDLPKVVRSRPLKKALSTAVRARFKKHGFTKNVRSDAIVSSDEALWLSTFDNDPPPVSDVIPPSGKTATILSTEGPRISSPSQPEVPRNPDVPIPPSEAFQQRIQAAFNAPPTGAAVAAEEPQSWIPDGFHFETSCGFHLSGAHAIDAKLTGEGTISVDGDLIRVRAHDPQLGLIILEGQGGLLLPVIPDYIGFIRFREGVVEDLAYEPSGNFGENYERQEARYARFSPNARVIRGVRETLASAARTGNLLLAVLSHEQIRQAIDIGKYSDEDLDPMLLVLLGYACVASGKQKWLPELCDLCLERLKFIPFDLKLLTETGPFRRHVASQETLPPFPLIRLGWSLLSGSSAIFREQTMQLWDQVLPSPWTILSPTGVAICKRYIEEEEKGKEVAAAMV